MSSEHFMEKTINKKEIRRIDWGVVKRLVKFLYYHRGIKKTNIALKCNLAYNKCVLYLDWLESIDLIQRADHDGYAILRLTRRSTDLFNRKRKENNIELKSYNSFSFC